MSGGLDLDASLGWTTRCVIQFQTPAASTDGYKLSLALPPSFPYPTPSSDSGASGFAGITLIHQINGNLKRGRLVIEKRKRRMLARELKTKTPDQLRDSLVALKKEAFNLRFQAATNQLENTSRMRAVRRDVARIKTVLNQKAAEAAAN